MKCKPTYKPKPTNEDISPPVRFRSIMGKEEETLRYKTIKKSR